MANATRTGAHYVGNWAERDCELCSLHLVTAQVRFDMTSHCGHKLEEEHGVVAYILTANTTSPA